MIFRILGIEEEISGQPMVLVRKTLHRLWLDWLKLNPLEEKVELRFEQLKKLFYVDLGFTSDWQAYYHSQNLLIGESLSRRCGNATSLAMLLHYFARKLDIECHAIEFPAQTILAFKMSQRFVYFDACNGEECSLAQLKLFIEVTKVIWLVYRKMT